MRVDQIEIGEIFAGKYRVERVLGRGSMGVVVAATHLGLGRVVALKFMFGGGAQKAEQTARFRREAQVAAMLKSPHAGQVLDVGELDAETPYIVMEYLEGQDLAAVLKARGSLPVEEAISLILQACDAVAEAHSMGIVHRDLKPANLFVALDSTFCPCMKVLDFGVSKLGDAHLGLTQTGQMLGSPLYMSPEQINSSRDADARSDIWALGVILYELLAGTTPFHADRVLELYRKLSTEPPSPLERHRPDVAPGLCAVIMQSLEKDRDRRWPSVAAFAAALAPYAPAAAAPYVARIARVQRMDVEAQRTTASLERPPLLRRMALPAAGAGVMVDVVSSGHASAPLASAATEIPRPPSPLPGVLATVGVSLAALTLVVVTLTLRDARVGFAGLRARRAAAVPCGGGDQPAGGGRGAHRADRRGAHRRGRGAGRDGRRDVDRGAPRRERVRHVAATEDHPFAQKPWTGSRR